MTSAVMVVFFDSFTKPHQILLCLIPLALTGGLPMLALTGFTYMAYKSIGKPSKRISKFVFVQGLFVAGKALGTLLLAATSEFVPGRLFCAISVIFCCFGLCFIKFKTGIKTEEVNLTSEQQMIVTYAVSGRKMVHIGLLFLSVFVYFLTENSQVKFSNSISNLIEALALALFAHFIRGTLKKRVFQNRLLPRFDAAVIGSVGWVTCIVAKLIYSISETWATYVSVAVRSLSQLSVTMSYYLLSTMVPYYKPGWALIFGTFGEILGTLPAKPMEKVLDQLIGWDGWVYVIQAAVLLVPSLIFVYFYVYYKKLKDAVSHESTEKVPLCPSENTSYGSERYDIQNK